MDLERRDDLMFRFLDGDQLTELVRLRDLAFPDRFGVRFEHAQDFVGDVGVADAARRPGRNRDPEWVFPSVTGSALDESNVRKALNRLLDAAGLDRRGPHQMPHTFASLLLQEGAPITYVSRQLGHRDASITLRVYAHWIPDVSAMKAVDLLDDTQPSATQPQPTTRSAEWENALSVGGSVVSRVGIEPTTRRLRVPSFEIGRAHV